MRTQLSIFRHEKKHFLKVVVWQARIKKIDRNYSFGLNLTTASLIVITAIGLI